MEERLKIVNNILEITDHNNNPLDISNIKLEFSCNKYSSKKNSIYHITLGTKHLSKQDKYSIKYKCVTCEAVHIVGTTQLLRKINKCSHRCNLCVNKDECKRQEQKEVNPVPMSLQEAREYSINLFEGYDDEFKEDYYRSHLTEEDYMRVSKNILSKLS